MSMNEPTIVTPAFVDAPMTQERAYTHVTRVYNQLKDIGGGLRSGVVVIDQVTARALLTWKTPENVRGIRDWSVSAMAEDQTQENWKLTHQGLALDLDCKLVDGFHRLHSIIESGAAVPIMVTLGDFKITDPIDTGRKRDAHHILGIPSREAAALRSLYMLENFARKNEVTLKQLEDVRVANAKYFEQLDPFSGSRVGHMRGPVIAALVYALPIDRGKITDLCEKVKTGEMISAGHPAYKLREWLDRAGGRGIASRYWDVMNVTLASCVYYIRGDAMHRVEPTALSSYRQVTTKRRALGIPRTPSNELVESQSHR